MTPANPLGVATQIPGGRVAGGAVVVGGRCVPSDVPVPLRTVGPKSTPPRACAPAEHPFGRWGSSRRSSSRACGAPLPLRPGRSLGGISRPYRWARASTRPIPTHKKGPEGVGFCCGGSAAGPEDGGKGRGSVEKGGVPAASPPQLHRSVEMASAGPCGPVASRGSPAKLPAHTFPQAHTPWQRHSWAPTFRGCNPPLRVLPPPPRQKQPKLGTGSSVPMCACPATDRRCDPGARVPRGVGVARDHATLQRCRGDRTRNNAFSRSTATCLLWAPVPHTSQQKGSVPPPDPPAPSSLPLSLPSKGSSPTGQCTHPWARGTGRARGPGRRRFGDQLGHPPTVPTEEKNEGRIPQEPPQRCTRRDGASEAAPEAVRQAVGGGCQSGWRRLLPLQMPLQKLALGHRDTVAGRRLGALGGPRAPSSAWDGDGRADPRWHHTFWGT